MNCKWKHIDRRDFLKGTASIAGIGLIGSLGCSSEDTDDEIDTETRQDAVMFSAASIGSVELKNRLIRAATEEAYTEDGIPTPAYTKVFTDLATGGVGAIICGIAMIEEADALPFELYAFDDSHMSGLTQVREAVREADSDCKLFAQVGHTGHRYFGESRVGPSDVGWPGDLMPMRALEVEEIEQIVEDFAQAIRRFRDSGWDGVELHGGHGYLISTFLTPFTNIRTDRYGGSVAKRTQIVKEIIERSRELVGDDFPIAIKINSDDRGGSEPADLEGGIDQALFIETANELVKLKIDAIEVSGNGCSLGGLSDPEDQSYFEPAAVALNVDIPLILTGGNRNANDLEAILETDEVAFIGISRPFIREPDLANKWLNRESDNATCISCNMCTQMTNIASGMRCHQES